MGGPRREGGERAHVVRTVVGVRLCCFRRPDRSFILLSPSSLFAVVGGGVGGVFVCFVLSHKGLLAIIHLAKKDAVCFDLGKAGAVQLLVKMWPEWEDDEMRQLLLWAMNEVARIGMCRWYVRVSPFFGVQVF